MVTRAVEEPKTLLYWVYHPYTQNPVEKKLINLDIKERINFPEGHLVQKGSEMRWVAYLFELDIKVVRCDICMTTLVVPVKGPSMKDIPTKYLGPPP